MTSSLQFAAGFAMLALLLLGVCGTIYKLIAPDGWLARLFGGGLGAGSAVMLAMTAGVLVAVAVQGRVSITKKSLMSDWWVYVFAVFGLIYLIEILVTGSL